MALCQPEIEFEKDVYLPGEEITGRAWVSTTKDMKAKSVEITFTGKAINAFKKGKSNVSKAGKKSEDVYVEMKHEVWAPENEENTFPAGDYEWKFSFELPKNCPPSFEGKGGFIRYSVLLHMDIPNSKQINIERAVTVSPIIDLNNIAEAGEPTKMELNSTVSFCHCFPCLPSRGSVIYELASPKLGYVSGETVIINGRIHNKTSKPIRIIQAKLNRLVTYREELQGKNKKRNPANAKGFKSQAEKTVLETKIERCQIQPDEIMPFEFSFVIPPVVATIRNSKCINVEYNVSIWADTGFCNKIEDASLNILVGNVPLDPSSCNPLLIFKMKSALLLLLLIVVLATVTPMARGQRRLPSGGNNYYEWLMRAQHGSSIGAQNPIVSSRSPKMDRNCFFSPVQCMFDTSTSDNLNSFRR